MIKYDPTKKRQPQAFYDAYKAKGKKWCSRCKKGKLLNEFEEDAAYCKSCDHEYLRQRQLKSYYKNKKTRLLYQKQYHELNRESELQYCKKYNKRYYKKHRKKIRDYGKKYYYQNREKCLEYQNKYRKLKKAS